MKKILFVQSRPPHGSLFGQEGLDAILMGTTFAECNVLLLTDSIFQLVKGQDTTELGTKNYSVTYGALKDYGIATVYCSESHLGERGLTTDDLLIPVTPISDQEVSAMMATHDVILSF